jgi:DNA-binding transcriptional LysR family regulator
MVITEPNAFVGELHDRMPVLLAENDFEPWLSSVAGVELLKPAPNDLLQKWPVSTRVNSSRAGDNDSTLIEKIELAAYRHAVMMLREAELAETAIRHRLNEPTGAVRCTAAVATMQFAMRSLVADFLVRYLKVNVVAHATDQYVDIVGENFDVAIRAHSDPLPDSTLVQRTLTPAPWFLFAGAAYVDANRPLDRPHDLAKRPSLFMMRTGVSPIWRLRRAGRRGEEFVVPLTPRLLIDDMLSLKQAAIGGLGIVALPGYVCRDDVQAGVLRQVLPGWIAGDSTLTALMPYRQGLLPSVRAFVEHLAAEFPKAVRI